MKRQKTLRLKAGRSPLGLVLPRSARECPQAHDGGLIALPRGGKISRMKHFSRNSYAPGHCHGPSKRHQAAYGLRISTHGGATCGIYFGPQTSVIIGSGSGR